MAPVLVVQGISLGLILMSMKECSVVQLVMDTGTDGFFEAYPYPYPQKPVSLAMGLGFLRVCKNYTPTLIHKNLYP